MDLLFKSDLAILEISAPPYDQGFFLVRSGKGFLPHSARNFRRFVLDHAAE